MNRRTLLGTVAAIAAFGLVLTGCVPERDQVSPSDTPTVASTADPSASAVAPGGTASPANPGDSRVYNQQLTWSPCDELECSTVQVPVDWSNPDGPTFGVAINRHVALDSDRRLGSMLINPGGPGGEGLSFAEYFVSIAGDDLLDAYDVIGFDPRGVGQSSGVNCGDGAALDAYYLPDVVLNTQADIDAARQTFIEFTNNCRELTGPVWENVDTVSAARDMDVIRSVLGDEQLNFLGYSYGTELGATYAELYPTNVGRMTLDGAVDFLLDDTQISVDQASGFELALGNFVEWCHSQEECLLDGNTATAKQQIHDMTVTAQDTGYPSGHEMDVNGTLMFYGIAVTLYDQTSWPYLMNGLNEVLRDKTASVIFQLANFYLDRDPSSGNYSSNSTEAFTAIGCMDSPLEDPYTIEEYNDFADAVIAAAPTLGFAYAAGTGCDGWQWEANEHIENLDATSATGPILVIGTTNDPATPIKWARSLTDRLGNASLLEWDGEGHTAYGRSNQCVIDAVDGYMVDGEMPSSGKQC
ncbi:alpha/beta hydrolase [Demequina aurantiaca]|uniref:alpha/beta hydrolase n=1 Tax=Demequina aurantiaca TaxID=676200 RepID=UPI0007856F20|nr:alpha/beta hydrolase [Demequina aurantiaca]